MSLFTTRKFAAPLATVLALASASCGAMNMENRSLYSVNQPIVERSNYALDVNTSGAGLPVSEQHRLAEWFESMDLRYGDRISIDASSSGLAVKDDVAMIAGRYGMMVEDGAPLTTGTIGPGQARIIITRTSASVPGCPDWSHTAEWNPSNSTNPNYGCATNSNLAAMIANPEDLIRGQEGTGETVVTTSTKAIKTYRDKDPTGAGGLSAVSTGGGQ